MSFEEIGLKTFLAGVVEDLGPLWLQKDVQVVTDDWPGGKISGDAILLRQVKINLLDNAWKYSAVGGTMARAIAELHGGWIDAENHKSGGVDFIVRLPGSARSR